MKRKKRVHRHDEIPETTNGPTFGSTLRGLRLGYRWSKRHGAFIRMSDAGSGRYLIEFAPDRGIPAKDGGSRFHRCWWDNPAILEMSAVLKAIKKVKRYFVIYIDDQGRLIK